jgi:thiamine biosynthesis lipoprotein
VARFGKSRFLFRLAEQIGIVLFLAAGCANAPLRAGELLRLEQSADAMGSAYSIVVYGEDQAAMENAVERAFDEVRRLDELLSNYRPESDWSQVNRFAAERPVSVPGDLFDLLSACVEYSRESEGAFDITVGPLMRVWGFYKGTGHLPRPGEIEAARKIVGWRNIELDRAARTVRFAKKGVEMDPGGIGKGYAVDRMVDVLRRNGIKVGLVSASGSSIYAMGAPPHEDGWHVDIKDPRDLDKAITEVVLKDQSMSTSGSYEKFFKAEGRVFSHIMDPRTGYPAPGMLAVSVITPLTLDSEAWTKPLFINGRAWAARHRQQLPAGLRAYFCEDKANQPCVWLQ